MRDRTGPLPLVNLLVFQAGWFITVFTAAAGHNWPGPLAVLLLVGWHLTRTADAAREARLIIALGIIGFAADLAMALGGAFAFVQGVLPHWLPPPWMVGLWLLFATTLRHSLAWLMHRPWLAAVLGGSGAPLSYYAGYRLGVLEFTLGVPWALAAVGLVWALVTPAAFRLASLSAPRLRTACAH